MNAEPRRPSAGGASASVCGLPSPSRVSSPPAAPNPTTFQIDRWWQTKPNPPLATRFRSFAPVPNEWLPDVIHFPDGIRFTFEGIASDAPG